MARLFIRLAALSFSALAGIAPAAAWAQGASTSSISQSLSDHQSLLTRFHQRIDDLEARIGASETLVATLKESALGGVIARTRAVIEHNNDMGDSFELVNAIYTLDGGVIFSKENSDGSLDKNKSFELYNGAINPGQHVIEVSLLYRGKSVGVFTYLEGYKFKIASKYVLDVPEGKLTRLSVVSYERDDITMETSDRLAVRYDVEIGVGGKKKSTADDAPAEPAGVDTPDIAPAPEVPPATEVAPAETTPAEATED